jgi:hypothetical protein
MKKYFAVGMWVIVMALMGSCAPDPRLDADAGAIRSQAEQGALDQAQARAQDGRMFDLAQAERESTSAGRVWAQNTFIQWLTVAGSAGAALSILALSVAFSIGAVGSGFAFARARVLQADSIALDVNTRQYPLMLNRLGNGRYTLTDPNTGSVTQLDLRDAGDRQKIAASGAVRLAGAVAYEARKAGQFADGVAMVGTSPIVVEGESHVR